MAGVRLTSAGVRFMFDRQGRPMTPWVGRIRRRVGVRWALRGLTLEIGTGETVGLVGSNGAGKTTLVRLLAGVYTAEEGNVEVRGHVGSLSVTAGLLPALTGRENALLLGVLAGMTRADVRAESDVIGARAELGAAYDRPASSYSG